MLIWGGEHLFRDGFPDNLFEFPFERLEVARFQGQPCGVFVSAVVFQEVAALGDGVVEVEAFHGACGARHPAVGFGEDDGGAVEGFRQAGSDDADDPFVPVGD